MAIKRPMVMADPSVMPDVAKMGSFAQQYPQLFEYLAMEAYEDGSGRQTATMSIFFEGGQFKLCLSDRDTGRTAWTTGYDLDETLSSLERRLASGSCEWRMAKPGAKRSKR